MTFTRTHVHVELANPHLVCDRCRQPIEGWHDNEQCGCDELWWNVPCGHIAGMVSTCPSWSPVDGCTCEVKCRG